MSSEDFYGFLLSAFKAMSGVCAAGAMVYIFMSAQEWHNIMLATKATGFHWSSTIIWAKDRLVLSRKDYHTQYEPIFYGWYAPNGEPRLCPLEDRQQSDLWEFDRPAKSDLHPMMKPIALAAQALNNSSRHGDAVMDLFGGSGTTLLAAEQTDRTCFMMELDPKYCDVICKRFIQSQQSDFGVFLLRDGQRTAYHELPEPQQ
jgi:DNA modification methylase